MNVSFRDVDSKVFKEFKGEVVRSGIKAGTALNQALQFWLAKKSFKKKSVRLSDLKPWDWKTENNLSERVDEALYGWKK